MNTQVASMLAPPLPATKEEINAIHNKFSEYGRSAKHWLRQCQMLLPRIRDEEVWKRKGFSSIYEYAAKLVGMSHNSVNEALRILDCLEDKPELKKSVEKFGLNKVSPVITIATEDTDGFWADKVETMSVQTLKTYVRGYRRDGLDVQGQRIEGQDCNMSNGGMWDVAGDGAECKADMCTEGTVRNKQMASMYMKLDVKTIERLKKLKGDMDWDEMLNEMLNVYEGVVDTENYSGGTVTEESGGKSGAGDAAGRCETQEKPSPVNTGKRYVPREIQKYVTKKTSGLCSYPGCTKPYKILHHTKRFAIDATHDPDTLKPLCKAHERLAHGGLIENEETVPVDWVMRKQPDINNPKYAIDKKVNEYYMPKLE